MPGSETSADKLKVFISYSRVDAADVDLLVGALESSGFTVRIDRRDLPYGEEWQRVIYDFIRDSDTVIFLVSEHSINSRWARWELQQVSDLKKRLLPVVIAPCPKENLPPAIARIELLPKNGTFSIDTHLADLVKALNTNRAWVVEATKLQSRTLDWINAGRSAASLRRGTPLKKAEEWRSLKPAAEAVPADVLDFLLSSRQQSNRRQRYWVAGSIAVAIGASALAAVAYIKNAEAVSQKTEADRQRGVAERQSNAAIAQSAALTSLASDNDPVRGLLLAHEALSRIEDKPTVTAITAHRNAVWRFGPVPLLEAGRRGLSIYEVGDGYAPIRQGAIEGLHLSRNGRWLLVATQENGTQEFWRLDLEHQAPASTFRVVDTGLLRGSVGSSAISNSGRWIAAVLENNGSDGVYVFELDQDGTYNSRLAGSAEVGDRSEVEISDDERYLTYGNRNWRLDRGISETRAVTSPVSAHFYREGPDRNGDYTSLSPDLRWAIFWNQNETDALVSPIDNAGNIGDLRKLPRFPQPDGDRQIQAPKVPVVDAAFSGDGRRLATIGESLLVWDLTATEPFARPLFNLATPGTNVAIDDSARWVASFGDRLQIWDLDMEVPAAFPVNAKSLLRSLLNVPEAEKGGSEYLTLRFAAKGRWLLVIGESALKGIDEFWDLRFNREEDGNLARRNLSPAEWRSFFGIERYRKTFAGQPASAEPMLAADVLARSGQRADAVEAYRRIARDEPSLQLDPERRAARLASQFFWTKGEAEAMAGRYDSGLKLLRQAKQMNSGIPWNPDSRAGQLWAQQYVPTLNRLGAADIRTQELYDQPQVEAFLGTLRQILVRYPKLQFDGHGINTTVPPGTGLYEFGLRELAGRVRETAKLAAPDVALRLRSLLIRERGADVPTEEELRKAGDEALSAKFEESVGLENLASARQLLERAAPFDPALAARMRPALELVETFRATVQANPPAGDFTRLLREILARRDDAAVLDLIAPSELNSMCRNGTTRLGQAAVVLPVCEALVARKNDPAYRDSRGVAYAALGRYDAAIADFEDYVSKGLPSRSLSRSQWIQALKACRSDPNGCKNPFGDPAFLRDLK